MFSPRWVFSIAAIVMAWILVPLSGYAVDPAYAGIKDYEQIFQHKAWQVRVVAFDDNSYACVAQVDEGSGSFLIWSDPGAAVSLQFYDRNWKFNNEKANVVVRVDRRPKWRLNDAALDERSVFFDLPGGGDSLRFLREIMNGNNLILFGSGGNTIKRYSLAGSKASILALIECVKAIKGYDNDNNPFN